MWHFLPIGGGVIIFVLAAGHFFHAHHLYHWMDSTLYHEYMMVEGDQTVYLDAPEAGAVENPNYDHIIAGKAAYFTTWFFWLRTLGYIATFVIFARLFRRWSLLEDQKPDLALHFKQFRRSAVFLVFFAVFSSMLSWDWLMSIDVHWFSTLYGWYLFSGMWVSSVWLVLVFRNVGQFHDHAQPRTHLVERQRIL